MPSGLRVTTIAATVSLPGSAWTARRACTIGVLGEEGRLVVLLHRGEARRRSRRRPPRPRRPTTGRSHCAAAGHEAGHAAIRPTVPDGRRAAVATSSGGHASVHTPGTVAVPRMVRPAASAAGVAAAGPVGQRAADSQRQQPDERGATADVGAVLPVERQRVGCRACWRSVVALGRRRGAAASLAAPAHHRVPPRRSGSGGRSRGS